MRTLGEGSERKSFIVEMSRGEYNALEHLQRVSEGRFNSQALRGLGPDMTESIMAVAVFVQVQDVIGALEAGLEKLREILR